MKKLFVRFAMSSRIRNATDGLDIHIKEGKKIQKRIENLRGKDQRTVAKADWVSEEELDSWRRTGRELIGELFGAESAEQQRWDTLWEAEPPSSAFDHFPEDRYLNRLVSLQAYLNGLKVSPSLSRNSIERVRDQIARHPVLGIAIALSGIVGTLFGIARGIDWLLSKLPL